MPGEIVSTRSRGTPNNRLRYVGTFMGKFLNWNKKIQFYASGFS